MINKAILTYDEQQKYGLPIINFEYLSLHPEDVVRVGEEYLRNLSFRSRVKERMSLDAYFRVKCKQYLGYYLEYEEAHFKELESSSKRGR